MLKNYYLCTLFFIFSCISTDDDSYKFPQRFSVNQNLKITANNVSQQLLAQVKKDAEQVKLVLLEPMLLSPLAIVEFQNSKMKLQMFKEDAFKVEDLEKMLQLMLAVLDHQKNYGPMQIQEFGPSQYWLESIKDFGACFFPERIKIKLQNPAVFVEIENLKVSCLVES